MQENVKIQFLTDFHTYSAETKTSYEEVGWTPVRVEWIETQEAHVRQENEFCFQLREPGHAPFHSGQGTAPSGYKCPYRVAAQILEPSDFKGTEKVGRIGDRK